MVWKMGDDVVLETILADVTILGPNAVFLVRLEIFLNLRRHLTPWESFSVVGLMQTYELSFEFICCK